MSLYLNSRSHWLSGPLTIGNTVLLWEVLCSVPDSLMTSSFHGTVYPELFFFVNIPCFVHPCRVGVIFSSSRASVSCCGCPHFLTYWCHGPITSVTIHSDHLKAMHFWPTSPWSPDPAMAWLLTSLICMILLQHTVSRCEPVRSPYSPHPLPPPWSTRLCHWLLEAENLGSILLSFSFSLSLF